MVEFLNTAGRSVHPVQLFARGKVITLNVTVFNNGPGPTMLLIGGVHGDEIEGPIALQKLSQTLNVEDLCGRVIILPVANPLAFRAHSRFAPEDGLDLNRSFPGDPDGSPTQVIAAFITKLIDKADSVFDFHAGGSRHSLKPCVLVHPLADAAQMKQTLAAANAFGAPVLLLIDESETSGLLDFEVERRGKIFCCAELGGFGVASINTIRIAFDGALNLLQHFRVTSQTRTNSTPLVLDALSADNFYDAPKDGIFEPILEIDDQVSSGDVLGHLYTPEEDIVPITARCDGQIVLRFGGGYITAGEPLFYTGNPLDFNHTLDRIAQYALNNK